MIPVVGPVPNFSERGSFRSINFGTSSGFSFNFGRNSERSSVSFRNFRNEFRNAERKFRSDPSLAAVCVQSLSLANRWLSSSGS